MFCSVYVCSQDVLTHSALLGNPGSQHSRGCHLNQIFHTATKLPKECGKSTYNVNLIANSLDRHMLNMYEK